ncbi:MAG: hypothetical protein Q9217_001966 [Psora testacea]
MLPLRLPVPALPRVKQLVFVQRLSTPRPGPRLFTQNSRLLLVSSIKTRPQLPFLHPGTSGRPTQYINQNSFQSQLARLLTTERKQFIKDQIKLGGKYTVIGWIVFGLVSVIIYGLQTEMLDRRYPPPPEWTFRTKYIYRSGKRQEEPNEQTGLVDWSQVGGLYQQLIERLEDPTIDGAGLQPILKEEGHLYVEGVGKAGFDLSAKSEPWRRGYFDCLMSLAKAAENRDGWVKDTTQGMAFPAQLVVGPSNPAPLPMPPGAPPPPLEENCIPAFESPATYYMKILTTQGFTGRQRLDAALAYADWLEFKGLSSTAEDMYDWGLDIAMGALPQRVNDVVDIKTGIINSKAEHVSSNMLLATTALASHHARNNNLAAALPIFLSILRARRQLPESDLSKPTPENHTGVWADITSFAKSALASPPYPSALPTGDEVPTRTPAEICEEAGIMANIGEILFASSTSTSSAKSSIGDPVGRLIPTTATTGHSTNQQSGLSWTREAVDLAEATLVSTEKDDDEARNKCTECLAIGMQNWSTMVEKMLKDEQEAKVSPREGAQSNWFWGSGIATPEERWESESKAVDERRKSVEKLLLREEQRKQEKGFLATLVGK